MTAWHFPGATLDHVVDGDTFYAQVSMVADFGFHVRSELSSVQKFRLNGCNAAPLDTPSGLAARQALHNLMTGHPFDLVSLGPYKYGDEWMASVTLPHVWQDGANIVDLLVEQEFVALWDGKGTAPLPPWPRTVS